MNLYHSRIPCRTDIAAVRERAITTISFVIKGVRIKFLLVLSFRRVFFIFTHFLFKKRYQFKRTR
ncbi:hypothetical protein BDZ89DRAFT_1063775 [Hymenopellis radicata]|nr:hypothetical protein BDZ89DRAFT_1063775 [Hymenopellis radicata]